MTDGCERRQANLGVRYRRAVHWIFRKARRIVKGQRNPYGAHDIQGWIQRKWSVIRKAPLQVRVALSGSRVLQHGNDARRGRSTREATKFHLILVGVDASCAGADVWQLTHLAGGACQLRRVGLE